MKEKLTMLERVWWRLEFSMMNVKNMKWKFIPKVDTVEPFAMFYVSHYKLRR